MRGARALRALGAGAVALVAGAATAGCRTWDDFQGLADTTSVWKPTIGNPGPRFGTILVGYETPLEVDGLRGTRLYVGGAGQSDEAVQPFATYPVWQERRQPGGSVQTVALPDTDRSVTASSYLGAIPNVSGCGPEDRQPGSSISNCGTGVRAAAPFPFLDQRMGDRDLHGCLAVTTGRHMGQERLFLRCEDQLAAIAFPVAAGLGLGQSGGVAAAGVPIYHPFGVAVFGAPDADGRGALIRVQHTADSRVTGELPLGRTEGDGRVGQLVLTGLTLEDGAALGRTVALTIHPTGAASPGLRIAAAFGASRPTVVVADLASFDTMSATFQVVGCLAGDADDVGFGSALAFGDFDGDGVADLAVGSQPLPTAERPVGEVTALDRPVVVFDGADFGGLVDCDERRASSARPVMTVGCATEQDGMRFDCAQSRFGHALAAGDLDGDGLADLIVGAPGVGAAAARAGVVEIVRGDTSLASMGTTPEGRHTLWLTETGQGAGLGWAVAAVPAPNVPGPDAGIRASSVRRVELAASQIGPPEVRLFYCSGLDGDSPSTMEGTAGASLVRGCGLRPGVGPSQLDRRQLP